MSKTNANVKKKKRMGKEEEKKTLTYTNKQTHRAHNWTLTKFINKFLSARHSTPEIYSLSKQAETRLEIFRRFAQNFSSKQPKRLHAFSLNAQHKTFKYAR